MKLFQVSSAQPLKDITHSGTHSTINGDNETHDKVAKDTGPDCHSPAEADCDHGRSCIAKVFSKVLFSDSTDEAHPPTSQFETAQASAIQYATYAPQFHVRFDGGIGSKSALEALAVFAKLLGS